MLKRGLAIATLCAALLGGCAGDPYTGTGPRENTGTLMGALAGGLAGAAIGGRGAAAVGGAMAGAAIGGLLGNRIGAAMDAEDQRRAYAAQMAALEGGPSGRPVEWRNPDSGRYGVVIPEAAYEYRGETCRHYTHRVYINGRPEVARGVACRHPDGMWEPVS
jgi:surface antigen